MALFGGLFNKKSCDLCGGEIGLLGNRKLDDGNCCKQCASKLSPWFSERRHSTVEQIREQLEYRERNREELKDFRVTRTIASGYWTLLLDENANKMIITKNPRKLEEENPDIIDLSDVTGARLDVDEDVDEIKRTVKQGDETKHVSYFPPRYKYRYQFDYIFNVNNPYFDEIKIRLNNSSVVIEPVIGGGDFDPMTKPEYAKYMKTAEEIDKIFQAARDSQVRAMEDMNAAPRVTICPFCTAETTVGADGRCEYCGGYIGQ